MSKESRDSAPATPDFCISIDAKSVRIDFI